MSDDTFAPPTPEEQKAADAAMFAPPTPEELKASSAIIPVSSKDQDIISKYMSKPSVPLSESARAGFASGGTFGFAPRIGAAGGALASKAQQALSGEPEPQSLEDLYNEYLKYNNEVQAKAAAGNPSMYMGAQFAGGLASPLNAIGPMGIGALGKNAHIFAKMAHGARAGARMGTVAGLSQSNDLADLPQDVQRAGEGMAVGAGLGAVIPPIAGGIKSLAIGGANIARPLLGKPVKMVSKGVQFGTKGKPNFAGEPGQLQEVQNRNEFTNKFVTDVHDILSSNAKNKRELISGALEKSQLAPAEAVQAIQQKYLEANPQLNEESARKELAQLKEMFITAAEGPKKMETQRIYNGAAKPTPAPSIPNIPLGQVERGTMMPPESQGGAINMPGAGPVPPPAQLGPGGQNMPVPQPQEPITGMAEPMGAPSPETPGDFAGYEAVHKATIDPADDEARALFQQKIHEKLADEKALGKNSNNNPVQMEEHPIPGTDKIRLVAKRAVQAEPVDAFKEQASQIAQKQREDIRLQQMLNQQNELKMKMQQQQEADMAKPQFQDVNVETREGGRNLQNPEELYRLQQLLSQKSKINPNNPGAGFSSKDIQQMSGQAAKDIATIIKSSVPGIPEVDQNLFAVNNVISRLKAKKIFRNIDSPDQGVAEAARQDASKKILSLISPEAATDKSQLNQTTIQNITDQLQKINPELAETFGRSIAEHAENASIISDLVKPGTVGGGGPILSAVRRSINKVAFGTGHLLGSQVNKMKPDIQKAQKIFQDYTPDALRKAAAGAAQSSNQTVQQLGQVLGKLATADDSTRNSMMFVLQQQAGYRQLMAPYFEKNEPETPQAKDKTLEKYK